MLKALILTNNKGCEAVAQRVDMANAESVKGFLEGAIERWGHLDAIVSATGPAISLGPLVESSKSLFENVIQTDVIGSYNIVQQGIPLLKSQGRPTSIVLFVTCAVLKTLDYDGLSFIPKKAVEGIIKQTAREVGKDGIRINGIAPGVIDAGIVLSDFTLDEFGAKVLDLCSTSTPMGRRGKASEVAEVAEFLISPRASYVSGQIIGVDGGYSA